MEDLEETAVPLKVPANVPLKVPANVSPKVPVNVPMKVPANVSSTASPIVPATVPVPAVKSVTKSKRIKRIKLGNRTFVSIRTYRKDPRVNIRDYMSDLNGDRHAMKRGILLTSDQWNVLKENMHEIDAGLKRRRVQ